MILIITSVSKYLINTMYQKKLNNIFFLDLTLHDNVNIYINQKICAEYKILNKKTVNKMNNKIYNLIKTHNVEGKIPKTPGKPSVPYI